MSKREEKSVAPGARKTELDRAGVTRSSVLIWPNQWGGGKGSACIGDAAIYLDQEIEKLQRLKK